ncbi:MAG: Nramp family divalent metal transporter [Verrucomicrobiia bacterium]|jgi:NRAMP (natural resistance-associated macrophage protein)-like metal ion transporter
MEAAKPQGNWLRSIGPGLVTACVVIGPGSILTSSKIGSVDGYSKSWVVVLAVIFMLTYTALAAKLAVVSGQSNGDLVRKYAGGWLAVLIGIGVFFISAAFQFGNNLGVHSALSTYKEFDYWVILFNALAIGFLFAFKDLYQVIEKLMACFVGLMLVSFAINLCFAKPDVAELARGFFPSEMSQIGLPLLGLVGTTFVITAAYYQSYLVRFKGWGPGDLRAGMVDARVSAILMALITLMLMSTAAAVLRGKELTNVSDVANSLAPLFGEEGRIIFCLGLFAAAFSSFLVNSMIGGFILSDGLNLGSTPAERGPRILTAAVLLVGMSVALYVIKKDVQPVTAIVAAQAVTVVAAPLMAGTLLWLTNHKEIMGDNRNGPGINAVAGLGFVLLLAMAGYTAVEKVWPAVEDFLQ